MFGIVYLTEENRQKLQILNKRQEKFLRHVKEDNAYAKRQKTKKYS